MIPAPKLAHAENIGTYRLIIWQHMTYHQAMIYQHDKCVSACRALGTDAAIAIGREIVGRLSDKAKP